MYGLRVRAEIVYFKGRYMQGIGFRAIGIKSTLIQGARKQSRYRTKHRGQCYLKQSF